ncbi:MAG: hypothetical protein GY858_04230 [Candidatus Omnitrophica bacterium]|nr:hypothetical protein [Candidatus Omnitrophota bacterium]
MNRSNSRSLFHVSVQQADENLSCVQISCFRLSFFVSFCQRLKTSPLDVSQRLG